MSESAPRTIKATTSGLWIERLTLTNFRNYATLTLETPPAPIVLFGNNGAGKTNLLEAVSMLAPGSGLRRAALADIARHAAGGDWAVASRIRRDDEEIDVGTGIRADRAAAGRSTSRIVRIDGDNQTGSGALADIIEIVWLTPALDSLLTGPASERRRFLDRLILCFDPAHRTRANHFERAMRQRNRLLDDGAHDAALFVGLEKLLAEAGVAMAAARLDAVAALNAVAERRRARAPHSPFPWAVAALEGTLEAQLADSAAIDVEDRYALDLARTRERDRAAGRTLIGPHRSDFILTHGPKEMPGHVCSTGEQKALLVGLVLAHAELSAARRSGTPPILLLDEIAAHLDEHRRRALFDELLLLGTQAWMTGTDRQAFSSLEERAAFFCIEDGFVRPM
ncbi:MAG: DNA replication/repair protein RecF [Alphaproteobacteria bacterium]|nr:DNA replication/repair protein RecF [Alphaproteobacteria bacterium]